MRERNRKGSIKESDLIDMIFRDRNGSKEYSESESSKAVTINIIKDYKDEELHITYIIDYKLFNKYKTLRKVIK